MTGYVCVTCKVEMRPGENDVAAIEMTGNTAAALWSADVWRCPSCAHEIIAGFGRAPLATGPHSAADPGGRTPHEFWHSVEARDGR